MFFPKRIPEPNVMSKIEQKAFEKLSKANYKRWLIPLADHALEVSGLKKGSIIDVACGPGLLVKELVRRSKKLRVYGIDRSKYAITLAKKNCRALNNALLKKGDVNNLDFPSGYFDIVLCKDSLHHFKNLKKALKEMLRITKKGGLLYLQDLRRDLPKYLLRKALPPDTVIKKLQFYSARAAYTKAEIRQILKNFKLKNFKVITRKIAPPTARRCSQAKINLESLKESFQSRYVAIIKK